MEYIVVLEKEMGHYRAVVPVLPDCVAEGQTRAETLERMRKAIEDRLSKVEITTIEVKQPSSADAWQPFIGMWKNDETWEEFQAEIANYRRQVDEEQ